MLHALIIVYRSCALHCGLVPVGAVTFCCVCHQLMLPQLLKLSAPASEAAMRYNGSEFSSDTGDLCRCICRIHAVAQSDAARQLKQYPGYPSNMYNPMGQYGLSSIIQEKKDTAMQVIDTAKQFAESLKAGKGKGKGAPMQTAVAPTYVVTSQPQIMVAPMPQLMPPPMIASAPQVQAPPPSPQTIYVPVPVSCPWVQFLCGMQCLSSHCCRCPAQPCHSHQPWPSGTR